AADRRAPSATASTSTGRRRTGRKRRSGRYRKAWSVPPALCHLDDFRSLGRSRAHQESQGASGKLLAECLSAGGQQMMRIEKIVLAGDPFAGIEDGCAMLPREPIEQ